MKRYFLAVLLATVLLAAGCGPQETQPDISQAYVGGDNGLALSFAPQMPPAEVYDEGQITFPIGIQIQNVGESPIGVNTQSAFGFIEIIGISPTQFGKTTQDDFIVTWEQADLRLLGAQRGFDGTTFPGETALVEIPELSFVGDRTGNAEYTVRANVCYEYRSEAQGQICIKDNVLELAADDTICTLTGNKPLQTSGAPVQVTQLAQNPAGADRIQITFRIENIGPGMVFAPAGQFSYAQQGQICDPSAGPNTLRNQMNVEVSLGDEAFSADYNIRCPLLGGGNFGTVRMFGGAPIDLSCTLETFGREGGRVFTDNFNVDLHYTYLDFIERPVVVRDASVGGLN